MTETVFQQKLKTYATTEGCIGSLAERLKREGYNRLNMLLLQKAISKLPVEAQELPMTQPPNPKRGEMNEGDALAVEMRRLIGEKNKLSNTLWDNQNNPNKCKEISVRILSLESDIEGMRERLRYFNEIGKMPEQKKDLTDADKLPNTKYELSKKLASVRTMISQVQEELEMAATNGDQSKLKSREKRLIELKNLRDVAENKLKDALV